MGKHHWTDRMAAKGRETLGTDVIPLNYNIFIETDLKKFKYHGIEKIKVTANRQVSSIALNSIGINVRNAHIISGKEKQEMSVKYIEKLQRVVLSFRKPVKGNAELHIDFDGTNDDSLRGFYRSKYTIDGKDEYILTTQFEPSDARKAFPCFDEPSLKATFEISLRIPDGLSAVSNMPIADEEVSGKDRIITFMRTPKMSSYLVYLGVGRFDYYESRPKGLPTLRVVTVPGRGGKSKTALEMCESFLRFYNDYFGIKYPLPKLDLLAIPDFSSGAMENWGAITFREIELLCDSSTSTSVKQRIAEVIAHELVHQWFGDLVTMEWWDDLWLNESFAEYMSKKAVENAYPKWQFELQSMTENLGNAFAIDQFANTHPISAHVRTPDDINEIFDEISYDKGSVVLGMLEDYAGSEAFRKGLHSYIREHSYSNAVKEDLWESISSAAKRDGKQHFSRVASSWIENAGYPAISVSRVADGLELRQSRFTLSKDRRLEGKWDIPVHYASGNGEEGMLLMDKGTARIRSADPGNIKLNYGQKGLYRTLYPGEMLNAIGKRIKDKRLSPVDGWGVEKDVYTFAKTSRIKVEEYMGFAEKYCMNPGYPLDANVSGHLSGLTETLKYSRRLHGRVRKLNIRYHKKILNRLGWKPNGSERNVAKFLRSISIAALGISGHMPTVRKARKLLNAYLKSGTIDKDIRNAVFTVNGWNGNRKLYDTFISMYRKEQNSEIQRVLMRALCMFNDPNLVRKILDFSLSKDVRLQDAVFFHMLCSGNPAAQKVLWKWTQSNWKQLMKRCASGAHMLDHYVSSLGCVDDQRTRDEIARFYSIKSNRRGDIERSIKQTLELIDMNIAFKGFNK